MADAYTGTSALSNTVTSAVDMYVRAQLRHQPLLRNIADTRPIQVDRAGSSVSLFIRGDLAPATTPLNELTDPDAVALPNPTPVTLTPYEYGNVTITSAKVGATSFMDVGRDQADSIAWNMRDTMDQLVGATLTAGITTNQYFAGTRTSIDTITSTDVLTLTNIRQAVTKLRSGAAQPRIADLYWAGVHPDVSADLQSDTTTGAWADLHKYAAPGDFWPGTIGVIAGAFFQESARMPTGTDGASGATVYRTFVLGREALAEGVVTEPGVRAGVVPDKLNRFVPLGWYGFLGWTIFRQASATQLFSGSQFS